MASQFFRIKNRSVARKAMPPVNILPQQRSKLTHIDELATTIRSNGGLINPINLICFETLQEAEKYARFFRKMYGDRRRAELEKALDGKYYFLVAGHRRFAALSKISISDVPYVSIGFLIPPQNSSDKIPLQAAFFQAAENIQHPPDPIDKAHSIVAMRNAMRAARGGKHVTIAEVVHESGQSEGSVSDALRFFGLPELLRRRAMNGDITFGRALIIGRLFYAKLKGKKLVAKAEIDFVLKSTLAQKTSESDLLARVNEIIKLRRDEALGRDLFSGGTGLDNIIGVESRSATQKQAALWMSNTGVIRSFIEALKRDPVLLASELASIYTKDPLRALVIKNVELFEELTKMLEANRSLTEIDVARVERATSRIRKAI